jgi:hypothetical protein
VGVEDRGVRRRDLREGDAAAEERRDRHLVGGVQHRRSDLVRPQRRVGEVEAREALDVGRLEVESADGCQVEPGDVEGQAPRVRQGHRNRPAHVRQAELREDRSVYELDQ